MASRTTSTSNEGRYIGGHAPGRARGAPSGCSRSATIDAKGNDYLPHLFGSKGYVVIRKPSGAAQASAAAVCTADRLRHTLFLIGVKVARLACRASLHGMDMLKPSAPKPATRPVSQHWVRSRSGFPTVFLLAALSALALFALWPFSGGALALLAHYDPVSWHAHEMLFGYSVAVIAGFLHRGGATGPAR